MTEEKKDKDKFYYRGTLYPTREIGLQAMEYFALSPLNTLSMQMTITDFFENLHMNLVKMKKLEERMTNEKFIELLDGAFYYILDHLPGEEPEI